MDAVVRVGGNIETVKWIEHYRFKVSLQKSLFFFLIKEEFYINLQGLSFLHNNETHLIKMFMILARE